MALLTLFLVYHLIFKKSKIIEIGSAIILNSVHAPEKGKMEKGREEVSGMEKGRWGGEIYC